MNSEINELLKTYPHAQRDSLIPILQDIQEIHGYLSEEALVEVSKFLKLPVSKIFGLATFYNQFRFTPKGKFHIRICRGTSCHVSLSSAILTEFEKLLRIKNSETSRDGRYSLHGVSCMGACGKGPVVEINGQYFTNVRPEQIKDIIENLNSNEE